MKSTIDKPQHLEENREYNRLSLYKSDGMRAYIAISEQKKIKADVYDLNPFGACLKLSADNPTLFSTSQKLNLELFLEAQEVKLVCLVKWIKKTETAVLLGLEFIEQAYPLNSVNALSNDSFPLNIPDFFSIPGYFYKPYLFFERCTFKIIAISEKIWKLQVYDSDLFLFNSQKIPIWILGFDDERCKIIVEVIDIKRYQNKTIIVQCAVINLPKKISKHLARQLVFSCDKNPVELRQLGLDVTQISNGLRFRFVKTQDEYAKVLELRYKSYLEAGKISDQKKISDMVAPMDTKSRILICLHGEKVVASVAIAFPNEESEVLDTERVFPNGYPKKMPPKKKIVEIARLCTDSAYRRTDLLTRMFEYTYKVTLCGDRDFILTSTDNRLWKVYKKLGFKKTGMAYPHPYLSGLEHHIILGERKQPDYGTSISPLSWNYLWKNMNIFMTDKGYIKRTFWQKLRIGIYKAIGRILRIDTHDLY